MKRLIAVMACFLVVIFAGIVNAQSTVTFIWDANPAAEQVTKYELYQSQVSGIYDYDLPVASTIPGIETVTLSDIPDGTYFWVLKAENVKGWSLPSAEVTATLDSLEPPGPPSNLIISAIDKMISALEDLRLYYADQGKLRIE